MTEDCDGRKLIYRDPGKWTREQVEQALREDDPATLCRAVCGVCMYGDDWKYAQDLCVRLWSHRDPSVRGIILTGLGHVARVHRHLDRHIVEPILQAALIDDDPWIRGNADDARQYDFRPYLGWPIDAARRHMSADVPYYDLADGQPEPDGSIFVGRYYCFDWDAFTEDDMERLLEVFRSLPQWKQEDDEGQHRWYSSLDDDSDRGYLSARIDLLGLHVSGLLTLADWQAWDRAFSNAAAGLPVRRSL